jgi:hypothetical protein
VTVGITIQITKVAVGITTILSFSPSLPPPLPWTPHHPLQGTARPTRRRRSERGRCATSTAVSSTTASSSSPSWKKKVWWCGDVVVGVAGCRCACVVTSPPPTHSNDCARRCTPHRAGLRWAGGKGPLPWGSAGKPPRMMERAIALASAEDACGGAYGGRLRKTPAWALPILVILVIIPQNICEMVSIFAWE